MFTPSPYLQAIMEAEREIQRIRYFGWSREDKSFLHSCGFDPKSPAEFYGTGSRHFTI